MADQDELLPADVRRASVVSGPADWPMWTIRAPGAAIAVARASGSPHSGSITTVGFSVVAQLVERHRLVGAELERAVERLPATAGRDDVRGTEQLCRLHGDAPDDAGRADTSTRSSGRICAFQATGIQPAIPRSPQRRRARGRRRRAARRGAPPARRPALRRSRPCGCRGRRRTRRRASRRRDPTASQPGTYGSGGCPP